MTLRIPGSRTPHFLVDRGKLLWICGPPHIPFMVSCYMHQ